MKTSLLPVVVLACLSWSANALSNPAADTTPAALTGMPAAMAQPDSVEPRRLDYPSISHRTWRASGAQVRYNETRVLRKIREATDKLFAGALAAGKSVVVTATINLDKYSENPNEHNALYVTSKTGNFVTDYSSISKWNNTLAPANALNVGNSMSGAKMGMQRAFHQFPVGDTVYQIYIVEPGAYSFAGSSYELRRIKAPVVGADSMVSKQGIGRVTLLETKNREFGSEEVWQDAAYDSRRVDTDSCILAIAGSNQCVSWRTDSENVSVQTRAAGYHPVPTEHWVEGLTVTADLSVPFASFTVEPGEAIVVDGLFAEYPGFSFEEASCGRLSSDTIQCQISDYTVTRLPASLEAVRAYDAAGSGYPNLAKVLSTTRHRALQMLAVSVAVESAGKERYILSAGK